MIKERRHQLYFDHKMQNQSILWCWYFLSPVITDKHTIHWEQNNCLKFKININRQNETTQSAVKWHESTGGRTDGWAHGPQQQPTEVYSQTKRAQRLDVSATDQRLAVMCVTIGLSQQNVHDCLLITPTRRSLGAYTHYAPSQQLRSNAVRAIHARTTDRHTRSHHRDHRRTHTATFWKFANRNTHTHCGGDYTKGHFPVGQS